MTSKKLATIGLLFALIGTGILGFVIPKKGQIIKAPNPYVAWTGIGLVIAGNILQMLSVWI